ncbi:outer membrane protein [Halomonas sp. GXIMD04776]|uniref:outer membrane protein n=1 Tax=Halomonas sp. GXIMD04776 TaxID=3415605 RepID=UPI003C992A73
MKKVAIAIALAIATAASVSTAAQAQGVYVFGEYNHSQLESSEGEAIADSVANELDGWVQEGNDLGGDLTGTRNDSSDDSDSGFGIGIGFRFHENFAAELAYKDLGEATYGSEVAIAGTDPIGGNVDGSGYFDGGYESDAVILRGVGILPITESFSLEALLGVAYVDTDYHAEEGLRGEVPRSGTRIGGSDSDSDFTATYGLGASFQFTDTVAAYGRWERIHDIDTADYLDDMEADTFAAGLRYSF